MTIFEWFLIAFAVLGSVVIGAALRFGIRPPPAPPPSVKEYLKDGAPWPPRPEATDTKHG